MATTKFKSISTLGPGGGKKKKKKKKKQQPIAAGANVAKGKYNRKWDNLDFKKKIKNTLNGTGKNVVDAQGDPLWDDQVNIIAPKPQPTTPSVASPPPLQPVQKPKIDKKKEREERRDKRKLQQFQASLIRKQRKADLKQLRQHKDKPGGIFKFVELVTDKGESIIDGGYSYNYEDFTALGQSGEWGESFVNAEAYIDDYNSKHSGSGYKLVVKESALDKGLLPEFEISVPNVRSYSLVDKMLTTGMMDFLFLEKEKDAKNILNRVLPFDFSVEETGAGNYLEITNTQNGNSVEIGTRFKADDKESIEENSQLLSDFISTEYSNNQPYYLQERERVKKLTKLHEEVDEKLSLSKRELNKINKEVEEEWTHGGGWTGVGQWNPTGDEDYMKTASTELMERAKIENTDWKNDPNFYNSVEDYAKELYKNELVKLQKEKKVDKFIRGSWWDVYEAESIRRAVGLGGGKIKEAKQIIEAAKADYLYAISLNDQDKLIEEVSEGYYVYQGTKYTLTDILVEAEKNNMSFQDFIDSRSEITKVTGNWEIYLAAYNFFKDESTLDYPIEAGGGYVEHNGRKLPLAMYEIYQNIQNQFIISSTDVTLAAIEKEEKYDDIEDMGTTISLFSKNYDRIEEFGVRLGLGTLDLVRNIVYGVGTFSSYVNPYYWAAKGFGYDPLIGVTAVNQSMANWSTKELDSYNFPDTKFKDIDSFLPAIDWTLEMVAENLPQVAVAIGTGGLGSSVAGSAWISSSILGTSSMGQKFTDMDQAKIGGANISDTEYFLKGVGFGLTETLVGRVTMGYQIGNAWQVLRKGNQNVVSNLYEGIGQYALSEGKAWMKNATIDGLGESLVYTLQLGIDLDLPSWKFVDAAEAFTGGVIFESLASPSTKVIGRLSGVNPAYKGMFNRNFADEKTILDIEALLKKQGVIIDSNTEVALELEILEKANSPNHKVIAELKQKIELGNREMKSLEAQVKDILETVEHNILKKGMSPIPAQQFIFNKRRMSQLRMEGFEILGNDQLSDIEKKDKIAELNREYKHIQSNNNKFLNSKIFGEAWFALKGNSAFNPESKAKVKEIQDEAIKRIQNKKNKPDYIPPNEEVDTEAINIMREKEWDANIEMVINQMEKGDGTALNIENIAEALVKIDEIYDPIIEKEQNEERKEFLIKRKEDLKKEIKTERVNGFYDIYTNIQFNIKDVSIKQGKTGTAPHEYGHYLSKKWIKNNPLAFAALTQVILGYLQTSQPDILLKMETENTNLVVDGKYDLEELFSSFTEEIVDGNLDFEEAKGFLTMVGKALNQGLKNSTDNEFKIDFKGENDILAFLTSFGESLILDKKFEEDIDKLLKDIVDETEVPIEEPVMSKVPLVEEDETLYQKTNKIYDGDKSLNTKALEIGELWKNEVKSRLIKGIRVEGNLLRPTTWDSWTNQDMEDLLSDMATGGSGVPGLVRSYKPGKVPLEAWINKYLDKRILYYIPDNLINAEVAIDDKTIKEIEAIKTEDVTPKEETPVRDLKKFEELDIVTPELIDDIKKIVIEKLKRLAITKGISEQVVIDEIESTIEKEITKVIKKEMGPISKSTLGFAPQQYIDFIKANMETILGAMPIDIIKQKAKSKDWAKIFKLKEIGKEDIKKVDPVTGKVTNYRKSIFEVERPNPKEFEQYFTRGKYTTLIAKQKSLIQPVAKELAKTVLFELENDVDFLNDLADRTGMTAEEVSAFYVRNTLNNMQDVLDQTSGEQRSMDVIKFSKTLMSKDRVSKDNFIEGVKSDEFKSMLTSNLANPDFLNSIGETNAIKATIKMYFYPTEVYFDDISNRELNKIADELSGPTIKKQVKAEEKKVNEVELAEIISDALVRDVDLGTGYKAVELAAGISEVNYNPKDLTSVNLGRKMALELAMAVGKQKFLRMYAPSLMGPARLAGFETKQPNSLTLTESDIIKKLGKGETVRISLFLNVQDLQDNIINATGPDGKKLVGDSEGDWGKVSSKGKMSKDITQKNWYFSKKWNELDYEGKLEFVNDIMEEGEINKRIFRETVEELAELSKQGKLSPEAARWFVQTQSADMTGGIKSAASLIAFPTLNKSQLRESLNLEENDPYVLEHMTPAKYMALLTYRYLLNPSEKNKTDFNDELNNFHTIILPDGVDAILRSEGKQANMGLKHKPGDDPFDTRYDEVLGIMELTKTDGSIIGNTTVKFSKTNNDPNTQKYDSDLINSSKVKKVNNNENTGISTNEATILDKALKIARDPNAPVKKIRVFDFDDTLAKTKSKVIYTLPDGKKGKLTPSEFAEKGDALKAKGAEFDFSEFNKVIDGKKGPLFSVAERIAEARGTDDIFILTARSDDAALEIQNFLAEAGINIPIENIIGLGDSSPLAKSGWIVDKAAEGYNDFYFVDDHLPNVEAVKTVLDQIDVKSKVQQAKIKFSKTVDQAMNDLIYDKTGIEPFKDYSDIKAQAKGRNVKGFSIIPYSAEDFSGLLYKLLGKGKKGDAQWKWLQETLIDPYNRGVNNIAIAQNTMSADFKTLKNSIEGVPRNLKKKAFGGFTFEDVTRVLAWDKQGINVEGLSNSDLKQIREFAAENPEIDAFADQLIALTKGDGYHYPGNNWLAGTITTDFREGLRKTTRKKYLKEWIDNVDQAFSTKNLNKLEAVLGIKYREAIEDAIERMKTGTNRNAKIGRLEARFLDYVNNSIGTVMFLNARSAVLQTISAINFLNWTDNNPAKAGMAFANQPQYWSDFMKLMNSDYLVDRRNGLKINVSESEIAEAAKNATNKTKAAISTLLSKGFVLTQFADSFAIASGGATFYRNRINTYLKDGMSQKDAETKAFEDFRKTAEESQQSADPLRISQQQSTTLGKIVLAFANTPSQYARIMKRATLDLANGRGDWKTNISKILYYGAIQNIMFTALQSALFVLLFEDEEEDVLKEKGLKTANSMVDNILKGTGISGAVVSTIKNLVIDIYNRSEKKKPDYDDAAFKLLDVSPPIDIKVSKFRQGMNTWEYNRKNPAAKEPFNINNPAYKAAAYVIASTTNVPLDRLYMKIENIRGALDARNEYWQRVAMLLGWPKWQLQTSAQRQEEKDKENLDIHYAQAIDDPKKYNLNEQKDILKQHGYTDEEIKEMKNEGTRVATIKAAEEESGEVYTARIPNPKKEKEEVEYEPYKRKPKLKVEEEEEKTKTVKTTSYKPSTKVSQPTPKPKPKPKPISKRNKILIDNRTNRQARLYKLSKDNQIDTLESLGVAPEVIETLKYEEDRVREIEKLYDENK